MVLEKILESPLDCKGPSFQSSPAFLMIYSSYKVNKQGDKIEPVHPKGDQSWVLIGRTDAEAETPLLWPPHVKCWLVGKDPDAGRDWGQEEKRTTEDEMAGWHHQLGGYEFE